MESSFFDLEGKIAAISGGAQGLGRSMALGLASAGADIVLADINPEAAAKTAREIEELGRRAIPVECDVSKPEQIDVWFKQIDENFGRIDFLGNVAGAGILKAPEDLTLEEVDYVLNQLVTCRFYCCQQAGRRMLAAGKGSIVNIGSLASITALGRGHISYSMGMGAVVQMTRELSTEWSNRGVRVNAILPAQVLNPGLQERIDKVPDLAETYLGGIPTGRFGHPDDIRGLAVFLASDSASWITGALIPMDGGNLAMNAGGSYPGGPRKSG